MDDYVVVRYIHQNGSELVEEFRADAFYSVLRQGELFVSMEIVTTVSFPPPVNSTWFAPTADKQEQIKMLAGLLKPFFEKNLTPSDLQKGEIK